VDFTRLELKIDTVNSDKIAEGFRNIPKFKDVFRHISNVPCG
jgi:hypothetical protein